MPKKQGFEEKITKLEEIASSMERDDLDVEKALAKFKTGMKISQECQNILKNAELEIQQITESNGDISLDEFKLDTKFQNNGED